MILKIFIFWRLGLFIITYLGSKIFPLSTNGGLGAIAPSKSFDYWLSWAQWDGGHFYQIAQNGYFGPNEWAFFPLFPALIKIVSFLTFGNLLIAGLLITNLAFLLFLNVFYNLVKLRFDKKIALFSTVTILTFPTTYFPIALYSEAIFLLLVASTLFYLEKKNYLFASICAGMSSLTRLVGIFLTLSILINYFEDIKFSLSKINWEILKIIVAIVPLGAYCLYLYFKFNDPFYFATVQSTWHRTLTNPLLTIYSYVTVNPFNKPFNDYLDVFLTVLFLFILAVGYKKIPFSWWIFSLFAIILPTLTGTLTSMPRYLLSSLGVFVLIGLFLKNKKYLRIAIWTASLVLQTALAIMFVNGHWTA